MTEVVSILGTVTDPHLTSWTLEVAPGEAAAAWQWRPLGSGGAEVRSGVLSEWSPLPADGVYNLRVHAEDEVGFTSTGLVADLRTWTSKP